MTRPCSRSSTGYQTGVVPTEGTTAVARWRDRKFWTRKKKGPSAGTIAAFHSYHTWVRSFSRPSLRESATTKRRKNCCWWSSAGSARAVRRRMILSSWSAGYKNRQGKCAYRCSCVLSTNRRPTTLSIATSFAGARSLRNTTADDEGSPIVPRWDESLRVE